MDNYLLGDRVQDFEILLEKFEKIPRLIEPQPTIMEIAGFPHYENVCSNILAYYLDTSNPHGLKNLLLKSLLDCTAKDLSSVILETIKVEREQPTTNQKRIDIMIVTEDAVIVIENKIYAWLYNDLGEYSNHVETKYHSKTHKLKIVLSLYNSIISEQSSGFISTTYQAFTNCIKANLGEYILTADNKAVMFLLDFLQTIQNLTKSDTMNPAIIDFFTKNQTAIQNLIDQHNEIKTHLAGRVSQLKLLLLDRSSNVKQWVYQRHDLVHDFTFKNVMIAVDCIYYIDGIEILVWVRKGADNTFDYLKSVSPFISSNYTEADFIKGRLHIVNKSQLPLLTSNEEIKSKLDFILDNVTSIGKVL